MFSVLDTVFQNYYRSGSRVSLFLDEGMPWFIHDLHKFQAFSIASLADFEICRLMFLVVQYISLLSAEDRLQSFIGSLLPESRHRYARLHASRFPAFACIWLP
jgi:hypothetical protein